MESASPSKSGARRGKGARRGSRKGAGEDAVLEDSLRRVATRGTIHKRPVPEDKLQVVSVDMYPSGEPLERPLTMRRKRNRPPTTYEIGASSPSPSDCVSQTSSPSKFVDNGQSSGANTPSSHVDGAGSPSKSVARRGKGARRGSRKGAGEDAVLEDSLRRVATRGTIHKRPVPEDGLQVVGVDMYPSANPLEQPLTIKKRRLFPPIASEAATDATLASSSGTLPTLPTEYENEASTPSACDETPASPPAKFVENGQSSGANTPHSHVDDADTPHSHEDDAGPSRSLGGLKTTDSSTSSTHRHHSPSEDLLCNEAIVEQNFGSEPESDISDDEADVDVSLLPPVSRVLQTMLDTPEDVQTTGVMALPVEVVEGESCNLNLYDFRWRSFPTSSISPEMRREAFSESKVGPTSPCVDPYGCFIAIWDQEIMEHIVSETNRYAQQVHHKMDLNHTLKPHSRIVEWVDTTVAEMYTFFGIILAMGMVVKSNVVEYWASSSNIFSTPGFRGCMSLRRFQLLTTCLHFNNNADMDLGNLSVSEAKLYKISPILKHVNYKFQTLYKMRQNIALDESLLQWKGWLDINQFITNKTATVGIKSYEVCESQTGYLWRFEIHAKKNVPISSDDTFIDLMTASTPAVVLRLLHGLENKGYTVWMDNYYNSPALARTLKTLGFDCAGTLRTNRIFVPNEIKNLAKEDMAQGHITGLTSGDVDIMVWRDKNRVATISTYHGNGINRNVDPPKPVIVCDYNIMMGGVDKKDQMLATYPIERKRTRVWYKKLFRRVLNVSVLNSYVIAKSSGSTLSHRSFRAQLITSLLERHSSAVSPNKVIKPLKFEAKFHFPKQYNFLKDGNSRLRRQCVICKTRVSTYCEGCDKPVCMFNSCFPILHH